MAPMLLKACWEGDCWVGHGKAGLHAEPAAASKGDQTGLRYPRAPDQHVFLQRPLQAASGDARTGVSCRCQGGGVRKKGEQALGRRHYRQEGIGACFLELLRLSSEEKAATVNFL